MTKEMINSYSYRITQASASDLVVITLDIIDEYVTAALQCFSEENTEEFRNNIKLTKRAVDALMTSLDMQYEVSVDLFSIYRYINNTLQKASIHLETENLDTVVDIIAKLRNSFLEVSKQDESGPLMKNAQAVYAGLTYSNTGINNEIYKDQGSRRGFTV